MQVRSRAISTAYKLFLLAAVAAGLYGSIVSPHWEFRVEALRYFTIQSNILVALALLFFLLFPAERRLRAVIRGSVLLSILVTGIVFHAILVPMLGEYFEGGVDLVNHLTHTVAPAGFLLDWLLFDRKGQLSAADLPFWVIFPLLYWIGTVMAGASSGFYPYFFMDVGLLGLGGALLWLAGLVAFFSVIGLLLVAADRAMGRKAGAGG